MTKLCIILGIAVTAVLIVLFRMRKKVPFWMGAFATLTMACMIMIFAFSAQDATKSSALSQTVLKTVVGDIVEKLPDIAGKGESKLRKYGHVTEYTFLGFFGLGFFLEMVQTVMKKKSPERKMKYWAVTLLALGANILFCLLYAGSDEFHQTFVPGRSGQLSDLRFDMSGSLIGMVGMEIGYSILWIVETVSGKKESRILNIVKITVEMLFAIMVLGAALYALSLGFRQ